MQTWVVDNIVDWTDHVSKLHWVIFIFQVYKEDSILDKEQCTRTKLKL